MKTLFPSESLILTLFREKISDLPRARYLTPSPSESSLPLTVTSVKVLGLIFARPFLTYARTSTAVLAGSPERVAEVEPPVKLVVTEPKKPSAADAKIQSFVFSKVSPEVVSVIVSAPPPVVVPLNLLCEDNETLLKFLGLGIGESNNRVFFLVSRNVVLLLKSIL